MTTSEVFQLLQVTVTFLGFLGVLLQIRQAQRNAMATSLLSAIANHWMLIEERRMKIRSGKLDTSYRRISLALANALKKEPYRNNLKKFADDFLWEDQAKLVARGKTAVFKAVMRDFAIQDLVFNLYEEEYIAKEHLGSVGNRLWKYWSYYIKGNFEHPTIRNYWNLRLSRDIGGLVYPNFADFIQQECIDKKPKNLLKQLSRLFVRSS